MKAAEWNELFFEERMSYLGNQPPAAPAVGETWRAVPKTNHTVQISNLRNVRRTSFDKILEGKEGKPIEVDAIMVDRHLHKCFPLQEETLWQ